MEIEINREKIRITGCFDGYFLNKLDIDYYKKRGITVKFKRFCDKHKNCTLPCLLWSIHTSELEGDIVVLHLKAGIELILIED